MKHDIWQPLGFPMLRDDLVKEAQSVVPNRVAKPASLTSVRNTVNTFLCEMTHRLEPWEPDQLAIESDNLVAQAQFAIKHMSVRPGAYVRSVSLHECKKIVADALKR